ncbi:MAG: aminoacyl-histidine dipeptidase [Lachnospiraceae bacterium]|nr:aminoacyl-histidine dipeptidase [Lachnospiraceae bacterium]
MNLNDLQPKEVFRFFYEICRIPHGSYNIDAISDYLVAFAKERNLEVIQDELKNVIIKKPATEGFEKEEALILQGHMDMVAVKDAESDIDLEKDALRLDYKDGCLYAEGTSLGGDDGIAVAYALAILDSDTIKHPALEVVITVNEEVGMDGAIGIDLSALKGTRLLNIDSEEEGVLLTSCAGGMRVHAVLPVKRVPMEGACLEIVLSGLKGGHSGAEIHHGRANANHTIGRILAELSKKVSFNIVEISGGEKDNAIPLYAETVLAVKNPDMALIKAELKALEAMLNNEYAGKEENILLSFREVSDISRTMTDEKSTKSIYEYLCAVPDGVIAMSGLNPGFVETSLNLGVLKLTEAGLEADYALRSSIEQSKLFLRDRVDIITRAFGGVCEFSGDYPGWEYKAVSPLREKMIRVYESCYGKSPEVTAIHAGLECGILLQKKKDLDCISFGPDIFDIHTTKERMPVDSVERTWNYLLAVLAEKENE